MREIPRWVDVLFARLQVRYGDAWARKWEGIDADAIRADWAEQIGPVFAANPKAIAHALGNLPPTFPPNSDGFLRLCMSAPASEQKALTAPIVAPPSAVLDGVREIVRRSACSGVRPAQAVVERLRARMTAGERLTLAQRDMLASCERVCGGPVESA